MHDVTGLLLSWRQGDAAALDRLIPLVYDELRRVARRHLQRELPGHALQATALVHEVYLRLVDVERLTLKSRTHFFAVAAKLMRQILVDQALAALASVDARQSHVVELRFFAGLFRRLSPQQ